MSDGSEWWVFDRAYRVGEPDVGKDKTATRINRIAERLGQQIEWIDLTDVPVKRLLTLCDYRSFQRLRHKFEELERTAQRIRGAFPELLAVQLLSQTGYHPVRASLTITFPDCVEREIDAVGIRLANDLGVCRIVEVKKQSASQHDIERYIRRLNETVQLVDLNPSAIAKLVGFSGSIQSVSGLFISMAKDIDMSDFAKQYGIEFWNFDRFVDELRKAGFTERYTDLLQESLVVWENDFTEI